MEKIIGGNEFDASFPLRFNQKLLWPCYEFIAQAEGLEDYEKNIVEEVVLRLAEINITEIKEIASCTGLDEDLISFIQSRLEQRECLDSCSRITDTGKAKLGEFSKSQAKEIHIYVDALSGRIIPYYDMVDADNRFKYSYGKEEKDDSGNMLFKYKGFSSAGKESDEMQVAYKLHYSQEYNAVPDSDEVTEMLHKLFPKKDGIFARIDGKQSIKKNLRWILLDVMQAEGSSRDWVFTDGFGNLSSFFSVDHIIDEADTKLISSFREKVKIQTNVNEDSLDSTKKNYPKLQEKLSSAKKCINELQVFVDSPDKEEDLISAMTDSMLFTTQLAEWGFYYILHDGEQEYKVKNILAGFEKFRENKGSGYIIAGIAKKAAKKLGFECGKEEEKSLNKRYGKLWYSFNKVPSLFALFDILLLAFEDEKWLKDFAKEHTDFISMLTDLNINRNRSFHSGNVGEKKEAVEQIKKAYSEIILFLENGLGLKINASDELSFLEKIKIQNERDVAISRMEQSLGFTLCKTLDGNLIRFITDMERRGTEASILNNMIIIDQYKILEHLFVSVNECLGKELKNSDWKAKLRSSGFEISDSKEFNSILQTNTERIEAALENRASSMNAACIAFSTLVNVKLLKSIGAKWQSMIKDVSYIAYKRGHGEIPDSIDCKRVLEIKKHIYELIKVFTENGFLTEKNFN